MKDRNQTAQLLNVSVATVIRLEKLGKLTPHKYTGGNSKVLYKESEINQLINDSNQKPKSEEL